MTQSRVIPVKVSNDCNFHFQWKQRSALGFLFQSGLPSLFTLPFCRCWGYCCAYFVRCWYYLWPCLVSRLWKRLIKHLYLPLNLLALFFTCLWLVNARAACSSTCAPWSQMCSRGIGLHGLHLQDFGGHPGMEERILLSSERNCLVTKV